MSDPAPIGSDEIAAFARRRETARANAAGPATIPASGAAPSAGRSQTKTTQSPAAPVVEKVVFMPGPDRRVWTENVDAFRFGLFAGMGIWLGFIICSVGASILSLLCFLLYLAFHLHRH